LEAKLRIITISGKAKAGKDTTANFMKEILESKGNKVLIIHFADYLKFVCEKYHGWDGKKDEKGRELLQQVGTNIGRARNPGMWTRVAGEYIAAFGQDYDYVLIPDTRFPDEIEYFKRKYPDTLAIKVNRGIFFDNGLTLEQKSHESECALDNFEFDSYLINTFDFNFLKQEVEIFLHFRGVEVYLDDDISDLTGGI
jgi:hypothetical protein